jgi:hypothetical protein
MGIATYAETPDRGSQAFYQRDIASYDDAYAVIAGNYWGQDWSDIIAKTYSTTKDSDAIVDLVAAIDTPITSPVGGTVLGGESGGLHLVKQGYAFPRAIQNLGVAGPKDLPYINAAKQACDAGVGVWDPANAVSDYFNDGHTLTLGTSFSNTQVKPKDSISRKIFLPQSFNNFEPGFFTLYRTPHADIKTFNATTIDLGDDIIEFDMKITNGPDVITTKIRALNVKQLNVSFQEFINDYYYFMTLGRNSRTLEQYSGITSFNGSPISDNSNPNPYYLNALIGPENLEDIDGGASDDSYIHFFLPLSEVAIKETQITSTLTYEDTGASQIPLTDGSLHIAC